MKEQQAVLDFFADEINLPLGLAVAEQMDDLRREMNNCFWREFKQRIVGLIGNLGLAWQVDLTEERNSPNSLVGLSCKIHPEQPIYLHPMAEQQLLGSAWRIYIGLMWNTPPSPDHLAISTVSGLKEKLQRSGFSHNTGFLAWQWTAFHPRRRDFLLRYAQEPEKLFGEMEKNMKILLLDYGNAIMQANMALRSALPSKTISLERLRSKHNRD